jgi:hypothetical protein
MVQETKKCDVSFAFEFLQVADGIDRGGGHNDSESKAKEARERIIVKTVSKEWNPGRHRPAMRIFGGQSSNGPIRLK